MIQSLLITNDRAAAELVSQVIRQSGQINLEQVHCPIPTHYQLTRALNTLALDVVFVDTSDLDQARQLCEIIAARTGGIAIIGFSGQNTDRTAGVTAHNLRWPFSSADVSRTVREAIREGSGRSLHGVFSVIPAKGGVGATTITVNVACHLAKSHGKSVLVAEADLRSGTIADHLNARATESIAQSLAAADNCISLIWPRHVTSKYGVDWMLTNRERNLSQPLWCDYRHLLTFASTRYDYTMVDLPSFFDADTAEVAVLSHQVFVVTTPEMLSLRLARLRIEELESLGVPKSRIQVLVNRAQRGDLSSDEIRQTLGCEIGGVLPNDYPAVNKSIVDGTFVNAGTKLGRAYCSLAGAIAGDSEPPADQKPKLSIFGFMPSPRRSAVRA